ncbi:MAG: ROK family protein [Lachnospiraceae bacterium]|nr:ROK family protein [Lachnospiraceae bacterium]
MTIQHEYMKNANALSVLSYIRENKECTRRDIQHATKLSWAAVSNIISDLIERQVLCEVAPQITAAGKNPLLLDFVPNKYLTIGVDLSAAGLSVVLLDLRCNILYSFTEPIGKPDKDSILALLKQSIGKVLTDNKISSSQILGIGMAIQGSVDREGTTSLYNTFFDNWRDVKLKEICEEHFHIPFYLGHDPLCVAKAEKWIRKLSDDDDFALIRLSYGVGMCYVTRGEPIKGYQGTSGELGHTVLNKDGPVCSCGNRGCLECYCSIRGLYQRILHDQDATLSDALFKIGDFESMKATVADAYTKACHGDSRMMALFRDAGYYLGIGIANVVNLLNPKYVFLIGDMLEYQSLFLNTAKSTAFKLAWSFSNTAIHTSENGRQKAAIGAALYFIDDAFHSQASRLLPER